MKYLKANTFLKISMMNLFLLSSIALADTVQNSQEVAPTPITDQIQSSVMGSAKEWGLTEEEWAKYQQLMQGADGLWYRQLSPTAVLGMRADNITEQQHYAEVFAKEQHDKAAREIAFNNAVYLAMRKLYDTEPMIKPFDLRPFNPRADNNKSAQPKLYY